MTQPTIIVFGATGHVGSAAAIEARRGGAKVVLALRDVQKPVPGLSAAEERELGFERVQADLTSPETVRAAVAGSGATRAFIYRIFACTDGMRAAAEALKAGGVEYVAFLSSLGVVGDPREATPAGGFVTFQHAQVEVVLEEVFGPGGFATARPGYFATNSFSWKDMVQAGEVKIAFPDVAMDWISPADIGSVVGALLVRGPRAGSGPEAIPLFGPEMISLRDGARAIGNGIGKDIKVTELTEQEGLDQLINVAHLPEPIARELNGDMKKRSMGEGSGWYQEQLFEEGAGNVEKYTGRPATKLSQWVSDNKEVFLA